MKNIKKKLSIILSLSLIVATLCGNVSASAAFYSGSKTKGDLTLKAIAPNTSYDTVYKYTATVKRTVKNDLYVYVEGYYYSAIGVLSKTFDDYQKTASSISVEARVPDSGSAVCDIDHKCYAKGGVVGGTLTEVKFPTKNDL